MISTLFFLQDVWGRRNEVGLGWGGGWWWWWREKENGELIDLVRCITNMLLTYSSFFSQCNRFELLSSRNLFLLFTLLQLQFFFFFLSPLLFFFFVVVWVLPKKTPFFVVAKKGKREQDGEIGVKQSPLKRTAVRKLQERWIVH